MCTGRIVYLVKPKSYLAESRTVRLNGLVAKIRLDIAETHELRKTDFSPKRTSVYCLAVIYLYKPLVATAI